MTSGGPFQPLIFCDQCFKRAIPEKNKSITAQIRRKYVEEKLYIVEIRFEWFTRCLKVLNVNTGELQRCERLQFTRKESNSTKKNPVKLARKSLMSAPIRQKESKA